MSSVLPSRNSGCIGMYRFIFSIVVTYLAAIDSTVAIAQRADTSISQPPIADAPNRPNIVFILIDDLRHDVFGFMNHPFVETPNIDSLASGGMCFENAFVTTSLCSPARASFLTGQYMHNHKVVNNDDRMREGTITFPQLLKDSGYVTAFVGKWHMGGSTDQPRPGFDHWASFRGQGSYAPEGRKLNVNGVQVPRQKYMTDELTDHATDWISQRKLSKPFLMYLSHKGVHGLYDPAPRHRDKYKGVRVSLPTVARDASEGNPRTPMWVKDQRNSWHGVEFPYHGRSGQTVPEMYRHYCEMVLSIDDSVGRILSTIRDIGAERNTLVIFTSDGGHLWGEHGLIDKRCAYEPSIRIPLLAYWPKTINPSSRCESIVCNIDVAPTLLKLAGVKVPEQMDGRSFQDLLEHPEPANRATGSLLYEYYWEPSFPQTPTTFAIRDERYKFIQYHGIWDTDELFDLTNDPDETNNLILEPSEQARLAKMRAELHLKLKETNGLVIPLGFKRNMGANLRRSQGSKRAQFPKHMIDGE